MFKYSRLTNIVVLIKSIFVSATIKTLRAAKFYVSRYWIDECLKFKYLQQTRLVSSIFRAIVYLLAGKLI